ncbi:hypothetical protein J6590_053239 [Homalodisca vitripennis]|nr:hypothetical protein J6590_053239 [Homalodisca vitripennis]
MLGARLGYAYMETPVLQLEQRFKLQSLYHRRIIFDVLFLFRLINGLVDCPALLEMVDLSVPRGTRSRTVFCRKFLPTNYACNSGVARILRHGGTCVPNFTFPALLERDRQAGNLKENKIFQPSDRQKRNCAGLMTASFTTAQTTSMDGHSPLFLFL